MKSKKANSSFFFFRGLLKYFKAIPSNLIPIIAIIPILLFLVVYDIAGNGAVARDFEQLSKSFTSYSEKNDSNDKATDNCIIQGEKYNFSKEVCDEIRNTRDRLLGKPEKTPTTNYEYKEAIYPTAIPDPDPIVDCRITSECGGGIRKLRLSVCNNSACCQIGGSWIFYESSAKCGQDQKLASGSNNRDINNNYDSNLNYPTYSAQTKIKCSYSSGEYQYDYGELTYDECSSKSKQYWDNKRNEIGSSIESSNTNNTDKNTIDTSACYRQYNSDTMAARTYGGSVGSVMKEVAQTNLDRCISTGEITVMGSPQIDSRPKDRDGKLCSEYGPELFGYSKEMGCP